MRRNRDEKEKQQETSPIWSMLAGIGAGIFSAFSFNNTQGLTMI
jgi:hypothetical protein